MQEIRMALQVLSVTSGIITVGGFLVWVGRLIYRLASAPNGYAAVLTGLTLLTFTTLVAVVALLFFTVGVRGEGETAEKR